MRLMNKIIKMKIFDEKTTWGKLFKNRFYKMIKNSNKKIKIFEKFELNITMNNDDMFNIVKLNKNEYKFKWKKRDK